MMNINSKQLLIKYLQILSRRFSFSVKIQFFIIGIASTMRFLMRVITKPSMVGYPCVRIAVPVALAFVLYISLLILSVVVFNRFGEYLQTGKIQLTTLFIIFGLGVSVASLVHDSFARRFLPRVHTMNANARRTLLGNHNMVSNKHIQRYLDEFCYKVNRRYYREKLFKRLVIASVSIN